LIVDWVWLHFGHFIIILFCTFIIMCNVFYDLNVCSEFG
jgi:hypothetical protein